MVYVVGDIHAGYRVNKKYSHKDKLMNFNKDGIVISLGDFGYPWFGGEFYSKLQDKTNVVIPKKASELKFFKKLSKKDFVLYIILGNHEGLYRWLDDAVLTYDEVVKGDVYVFNIFNKYKQCFYEIRVLKRLGIYEIEDKKILTIGGAYSSDRTKESEFMWQNEQVPFDEIINFIKTNKEIHFDGILTHACPLALMNSWIEENDGDKFSRLNSKNNCKTSLALNKLYFQGNFKSWYFGHLHLDKEELIDDILFKCMFDGEPFGI